MSDLADTVSQDADDHDATAAAREPVVLSYFPTVEEAHMAAARLEAEGIEAHVEPFHAFDTMNHLQFAINPKGIAVRVRSSQFERAQQLTGLVPGLPHLREEPAPPPPLLLRARQLATVAVICWAVPFLVPFVIYQIVVLHNAVRRMGDKSDEDARQRIKTRLTLATMLAMGALLTYVVIIGSMTNWFGLVAADNYYPPGDATPVKVKREFHF